MPVRNCEKTIEDAISSIQFQKYDNWELLIMDDGSSDRTMDMARSFNDKRIHIFIDGQSHGLPARMNQAIEMAKGSYFARMDGDDIAYPMRLQRQIDYLQAHPEIDITGGQVLVVDGHAQPKGKRLFPERHSDICKKPWAGFPMAHPTFMGSIQWFKKFKYNENLLKAQDQDLLARAYMSSSFSNVQEVLLAYRDDGSNLKKTIATRRYLIRALIAEYSRQNNISLVIKSVLTQYSKMAVDIVLNSLGVTDWLSKRRSVAVTDDDLSVWRQVRSLIEKKQHCNGQARYLKKKVAIIVSTPMTVRVFLLDQIRELSKIYDVTVIANMIEPSYLDDVLPDGIHIVHIPIMREINIYADLRAFFDLLRLFKKEKFDLAHSISPKAGMLAMLASWVVRIPVRLHTFTGQVWATKQGFGRTLLRLLDRLISMLATTVLVDSHSQRSFLLENRVVTIHNSIVLGEGSISGVDSDRFRLDPVAREQIRGELGVSESTVVILYLGRLKREKGVLELSEAFSRVHGKLQNTVLWYVGPDEERLQLELEQVDGVHLISFTKVPEQYMAAADIFCLPSYREGFGSVVIEAASCGIPSIGSNIYGLSDAIVDGETGVLVSVKSVSELEVAMQQLIEDEALRYKMGKAAHARAVEEFSQGRLSDQLMALYKGLLERCMHGELRRSE